MNTDDLPPWRDTHDHSWRHRPARPALTMPTNQKKTNFFGGRRRRKRRKQNYQIPDLFSLSLFLRSGWSSYFFFLFFFNDIHPPIACRHRAKAPHLVRINIPLPSAGKERRTHTHTQEPFFSFSTTTKSSSEQWAFHFFSPLSPFQTSLEENREKKGKIDL